MRHTKTLVLLATLIFALGFYALAKKANQPHGYGVIIAKDNDKPTIMNFKGEKHHVRVIVDDKTVYDATN